MTPGEHYRTHVPDFGDDHLAGIGQVVGIADVKNFATAIRITNGCDVFRSCAANCRGQARLGWLSLCLHRGFQTSFLMARIVSGGFYAANIAKVIRDMLYEKQWLPNPLICTSYATRLFCNEV